MPVADGLSERMVALIKAAPSQAALARLGKVSEGTVINWRRGLGYRESDMIEFCRGTGVSIEWLRDGRGDQESELAKVRKIAGATRPHATGARAILRAAREKRGLTIAQLSKLIRYPADYIEKLESGTVGASEKVIDAICRELPEISKEDLMSGSDDPMIVSEVEATYGSTPKLVLPPGMTGRYVPLLSMAEAGPMAAGHSDAFYNYTAIFAPNVDDRRAFAIKVSGNSMEPEMREGDVVICSPESAIGNGDAAVVRTQSEQVFIKYWRKHGDRVSLESANPDYKPLDFPLAEIAGAWPIVQRISSGKIKKQL